MSDQHFDFLLDLMLLESRCDECGDELREGELAATTLEDAERPWCLVCAREELLARTDDRISTTD